MFLRGIHAIVVVFGICMPAALRADEKTEPFAPTSQYESRDVKGWTVLINKEFLHDQPELAGKTLSLLDRQLEQIVDKVPDFAIAKLRLVRIWVEEREPHHPCMAYHPDPGWLRAHDMNPAKARCVEIANARKFLDWVRVQPWMVLHELAHAYHHQFLSEGFENPEIAAAYRAAKDAERYEKVRYHDGSEKRAYAMNNPMEYFAEASEAFFGKNDFYPFNRAELAKHDPGLEAILVKVWGAD